MFKWRITPSDFPTLLFCPLCKWHHRLSCHSCRHVQFRLVVLCMFLTKVVEGTASHNHCFGQFDAAIIPFQKATPPPLKSSKCILHHNTGPADSFIVQQMSGNALRSQFCNG